ncbi:SDR family oxidoreductase [Vitiosangium sp. GDMCC 1.1324]|uniref:SDR family NAD(P)-dependent oxidoreductase n=1 Tax=Vitiosangium sp. (strain GDMCC 1.1324) TaxID=2138576 RepID=UPI000D371D74|nr:SDR family oxidoreductase [Vitiosangium sp. GDMCC 1.1324]PTL85751.1 short-chain dehydrogenase [Vitiosangium sp. GDMCC 1.1324]
MKLQKKIVVVTGGGNGMGRELVLALLSKGASVAAVDINAAALQETVELAGMNRANLATYTVNITDRALVDALPEQVISRFGAVDGIINNAGIIQPFVRLKDLDYAAIDRVMNVNLFGTLYMTKAFLPHLLARPEAHITNISSMGGFLPVPGQTIYGAAKAAVKLLTEGLNSELLGTNVRVTVVFPGAIGTNIAGNSGVVIDNQQEKLREGPIKVLAPGKAAQIIIEGIEQNRYRVLVGSDATLMDAVYRLNPQRAARFIYNQMSSLLPK